MSPLWKGSDTGTIAKVRPIVHTSSLAHTMVFVLPTPSPPCHTRPKRVHMNTASLLVTLGQRCPSSPHTKARFALRCRFGLMCSMHGVLATKKAMSSPDSQGTTFIDPAVASKRNTQMAMPVPATNEETLETPKATADPECDEEEAPTCHLRRKAASPFSKAFCSEQRTPTLLGASGISLKSSPIGSSRACSRPNWHILAKKRTLTTTPKDLLRVYYQRGYPADLVDKARLPCTLPQQNAITAAEWQRIVTW